MIGTYSVVVRVPGRTQVLGRRLSLAEAGAMLAGQPEPGTVVLDWDLCDVTDIAHQEALVCARREYDDPRFCRIVG